MLTPQRRLFAQRELWIGVALALVIALPSLLWQAANHFPFAELVRAAGDKNVTVPPLPFLVNQVMVMNPLFAPLWLAGIAAPFLQRDLAPVRFLALAFVFVTALIVASHGKDYYLAAAYPPLLALGAVALDGVLRQAVARVLYLGAAVTLSAVAAPLALPVLAPPTLIAYMQRLHLSPSQSEKSFAGTALPQEFADQLGWHDFVRQVGTAFAVLPADVRARTSIVVNNYGEAAALDVYGAPYGLPPALSGHNQYYLWGQRGQTAENILRVDRNVERLKPYCDATRVFGTTFSPYAMAYENGKSITFCTRVHPPLRTLFPLLKNFS